MPPLKKRAFIFILINSGLIIYGAALLAVSYLAKGTPLEVIISCPMHRIFGIYCPFCGGTRAIGSILQLDIIRSLTYNPAVIPSIIYFLTYDIKVFVSIIKKEDELPKPNKYVLIALGALLILNWIVRNAAILIFDVDYIAML